MNFDTAIDPNQLEFRDAIARWVKEVGDKAESQGLEVKSTLGFNAGGERNQSFVKIIKFILGAANRDELKASRDFNGYGVMLIGISKSEVHGVESVPEQHRTSPKRTSAPPSLLTGLFPTPSRGKLSSSSSSTRQ